MSLVNRPTSVQSSEKRLKAHGGEKILPVNYDIHSHHCECVRYHFFLLELLPFPAALCNSADDSMAIG